MAGNNRFLFSVLFVSCIALLSSGGAVAQVNVTGTIASNLTTATGNYTTFLLLIQNPTYVDELELDNGDNQTIFAPTNTAFESTFNASFPTSDAEALLNTLKYHIATRRLTAAQLVSLVAPGGNTTLATKYEEGTITVSVPGNGSIFINSALVIEPNIMVTNTTVVHGIDRVLEISNLSGPGGGGSNSSATPPNMTPPGSPSPPRSPPPPNMTPPGAPSPPGTGSSSSPSPTGSPPSSAPKSLSSSSVSIVLALLAGLALFNI